MLAKPTPEEQDQDDGAAVIANDILDAPVGDAVLRDAAISPAAPPPPLSSSSPSPPTSFPVPSALKVLAATRHSIRLQWNYTSNPGGRLAGFRIFYFHHQSYEDVKTIRTPDTAAKSGTGPTQKGPSKMMDSGQGKRDVVHYYELTGLGKNSSVLVKKKPTTVLLLIVPLSEPYTFYEIWVKALVNGEETTASPHIKANTDVAEPSAPSISNATCHGNGSLYVEWRRPNKFHKAVDSYMLYYRKKDEDHFDSIPIEALEFEEVQKV